MFSGYQEREEYEDQLYCEEDEDISSLSEPDSELEFQLYSQLHYSAEDQEEHADPGSSQERPQKATAESAQRDPTIPEVIVIDSDAILISDAPETEESVCTTKGQKSRDRNQRSGKKLGHHSLMCPPQRKAPVEVVIVESGDSSDDSESILPFVADFDSDSDSDGLESWMILGRGREEGDQDIQLNVSGKHSSGQQDFLLAGEGLQSWAVSEKDKEAQIYNKGAGQRRWSNRYYTEKTITCRSCKKLGHLSKNCPSPKKLPCCSLCGVQGHFVKTCPNRHCSNCSLPGHTYDDCLEKVYWHKRCHRCGMIGHFFDACPDIWRQYHITTTVGPPVKGPLPNACRTPAYCYNCSKQGHFGHECMEKRMFNGTYPTQPFVACYDDQSDFRRLEHRINKQAQGLQEAGLLDMPEDAVYTPQPPRKKQKHDPKSTLFPFTPTGRPPKKRIAHSPKHPHPPQSTPKVNSNKPTKKTTPLPQLEGKKKNKNKNNKNKKKIKNGDMVVIDVDDDFPRGFQRSPHSRAAFNPRFEGGQTPTMLFGSSRMSEKSNKKKNKIKKWARKAGNDHQASDENLFLIKQRKRSR
ncbi:zinc finger CCHC domain-containing protein 7 [Hoplias malabaricus]|uniref:zinc finger CCHC domain-containing protein 7 n=1 Tax=Hoplias malabaricus TaxID=27720 RepID=UPI00346213A7